jgi:hypothetical protein
LHGLVAAAMSTVRLAITLAAVALGYLVAMVLTGAQPMHRQRVAFEAKGVLATAPENLRRVEISRGTERVSLVRTGDTTWATGDGVPVAAETGRKVSMAVQMMHTSAPTRLLVAEELEGIDLAGFELELPRVVASLYAAGQEAPLTTRFGARNPDGYMQYMRVDGRPGIYLVSRFVGDGWLEAMERIVAR